MFRLIRLIVGLARRSFRSRREFLLENSALKQELRVHGILPL